MQDENFFTRNFGAATPLAAPSLAKTPAPESDGTQGFSLADSVKGDLVFEPDDELVEKCANLNMQGKRYDHLAPLYFNAESKAALSKKVEYRTREKHRQDFDSLVKFAKNIRNFGTGEIYDDGTYKGEGVDANTAKSLGDSTARSFIRLLTDGADFKKVTGFNNTEELGRAAARVILYCTETDAEASARYDRASDESVYRELELMQSASGIPERMRVTPGSKEEAVGALAKIRKTGASRMDAALQIAGSEVALKKAFALSLMNEGGAERFLRSLSEKDPAEADRIFRAAMLISPAEEGGFIQAGKNLLWMGKNGLYHGLVDLVSAVRAGKDSTQEDAFYVANRWLQENKLGGVMTEETLNSLDEEQKKSLYEFVSKTVKAVDLDKMKPETTIGAPGWEAASLFRTLSFPKKAYSPEALYGLIREGMKIFAEKYGETKAEELASPKLHDDQWAQSLANEAAFSLAYMTPSLVAASAGGAPGFAIAMGLQGFGESYNERYSEGDVTSTAGERAVSAALYGAFMGTTNAFLYSSFANGGKWVWNKVAGTSIGAKIGSIIPGSALTRFATRSITDSDELFLARYGNSVAQRTCALLGRHLVRQSSLMLEEGSTEALEEAFKRFANESILESKTYDGSDVDRGNLVEALWESFKVGALIAPGIHMAMSPGSVTSTASLYTKKRSDLGSGEGDDASTVMRAKSERLWAFVGSSEAASQRKTAISGSGEDYSNYVKFATAFRNFLEKGEKPKEYDSLSEEQRRFFDRASEYWKNTDERGKNAILSGVFFGNVSSRNGRHFTSEELRNAMVIMTDELIRTHLEFNIREAEDTLRTLEAERDRRALPGAVLGQEEESKSKNELLWIPTSKLQLEIEKAKASIEELKRLKEEKENNIRKARDSFGTFGLSEEDVEAASEAVGSKVDESAKETIRTWIQESYDKAKAMGDERGVKSAEIYARANGIKLEERAAETKTATETDTETETETKTEAKTAEAPVVEETPEKVADEAFANGKDDAERVRIAVQSGHFVDEEAAKKAVEEAKSRKEEADKRKAVIDELRGKMKALEKLLGEDFEKLYGASAEQLEILSAVASAAKRMKLVESLRAAIRFMSESNWNVEPNIAKGQKGDSFMKAVSVLLSAGKAKNARAFARNIRAIERLYKSGKLRKGSEDSESVVVLAANLALANDSASAGTKSVIKQIKSVGEINDIFEDVGKSVADATSIDNDPFGVYGEYADEVGEKHKFPSQYPSFRELIDRVAKKRGVPKEQVYDEAQEKLVKALRSGNFSGRNAFAGSVVQDAPLKPNEWRARTPSAEGSVVVSGEYRVVDADELTFVDVSDKAQQDEQERNRSGKRTQSQTRGMLSDFVAERLLEDAHTDRGAPIYRELEDGKLRSVSGEGRSRLIKQIYDHGGEPEAQYRAALEKFAAERGIPIPEGVKRPVLVRVAKDAGGMSWDKLAKASNMDMKASYTSAERSHADARELPKIVGLLNATESGDIMNAANDAFLSAFNEAVQAGTTYIQDAKEGFNEQLGKRALEALVAYVINDREVATRLLDSPISLGHIYDAIYDVAPTLVRMRANERYDLSREISAAIKAAIYAKTQRENGNPNGPAGIIETYFSDNTFEGIEDNPRTGIDLGATKMLAKLMVEYGNRYKLKRVLKDYAESVRSKNGIEGENMSLFGETEWGTKADLVKEAVDKNAGSTAKLSVEEGTGSPLVKFRRISRSDQQRLASLLGEWLPGVKVRVVDSIAEATGDANAKMMRERGAEEPFGAYDPEKNEVIVRKHARVDTLMHELAWHATFEFARRASEKLKDGTWNTDETLSRLGEDKVKAIADIYAKMREFAANAPESLKKSLREAYEKQIGTLDEEALLDEYGARLFTELYTGKIDEILKTKVADNWVRNLAKLVSKAWKLLCEALSGKGVNLERIAKMDASDAMNALADAFARGKRFVDEGKANKNVSIETTEDDPAKDIAVMQEAFFRRLDAFARANPQMRFSKSWKENRYSLARDDGNADADYLEPSDFGEDGRVKPEILAEIEAEKAKIREDAQKNGSFMKAPNGAPSNLNAEQWVLVRTKRFKRWFGDWEAEGNDDVSKVVDESGEPKVVYHGTWDKFNEFSREKLGGFLEIETTPARSFIGFWFSENPMSGFDDYMECFINLRSPKEYESLGGLDYDLESSGEDNISNRRNIGHEYRNTSIHDGNDGVIINYDLETRGYSFVAFFPEQIKSATGNVGTYARENPDIRYSLAMEEDPFESLDEDVREAARKLTNHEQLKQLWEDAFGWWANKVLDAAGIARDSEEGVKIREFYSWETAYAQILKEYRDGDTISAANERMRRRAERKSGVNMSKRVSGVMNRYGIRAFDGSAGWARNAWKAIVEADGDGEEALEILKGIIMPHYHRLAVRSLSAAKAIEAESLVDRIDDANTAESVLKIADKLEKTLAEASDSQALEALRENTKRLLQRYGSGAFRRTTDLANRKFYGGAEKLLSDLYKYSKLRNKDAWRQIFENRQAELINEIESPETSEQKRVEDVAELQALGYWWAKPLKDMSAAELIALGDRIAETAVQGVTALDKAIEARKASAESAWSDVRTAVMEGVAKRGDRSQKSHILRAISTIGYSLQARLESAIRYAGEGYQKAIDSIRSLDRRITEANNIAAAKVERDEHAFFSAILRYAGEENRIVPDSKSKGYGAMSRAAENELVKLCLFAEGGERFSKRGEKLTWLELMAQYLMMNQKEWADMFAGLKPGDVPEGSREAYDRWARNAELAEFLGEAKVKLAEETSAILQAHAAAIDAEAVKITGTTLSYSRGSGYFPIVHNIDEYMANVTPNVSGGVPSVVPKILIPRQHSRKDIDEHADLFSIFRRHVYDVSLFEAQGETGIGSDLREFLGEDWKGVREDVAKIIGNRNANDIWKQMAQTLNGKSMGSYEDTASGRIVSASARVMRFFARMLGLGFNIVSTAKQAFGSFPSYMLEYGATNTLKALLKNPLAALDFAQELIDSDGYAQRYGSTAADRAMGVISRVRSLGVNTPKAFQLVARFENLALIGTSYGDRLPMFAVGAPIYATMVDKYLRDGNTVEEAKRLAMSDFWAMTDKTQQARQIHNQDLISSGANEFNKMFVQFLTSPIQFASIELHAAEMFIAHPSKENFDKLVNSVVHNHLIQPLIMGLIVYYVRGIADDDEEDFIAKLEIKDFAMGSFASMPYFGSIAEYYLFSDYSHGYGATAAMSPAGADVTFKLIERSAKLAKSVFDEKDGSTEKAARKLAETSAAIRYAMQIYDKYEED